MAATDTLKIDIAPSEKGVTVTLLGSASMDLCDHLNESLVEACQHQPRVLAVVMSELDFICSLGLGALVVAYVRVQKFGGEMVLVSPPEPIRKLLTTTKLGMLLPIRESIEEAYEGA